MQCKKEICMKREIKRNIRTRELIIWLFMADIALTYIILCAGIKDTIKIGCCIGVFFRVVFDYLNMFFVWTPIRYEEYKSDNVSSYILEWTALTIIEFIIFIVAGKNADMHLLGRSLIVYAIITFLIRYKVCSYTLKDIEEFYHQIKKDLQTNFLLSAYYPITNIFLILLLRNHILGSVSMVAMSLVVSLLCTIYNVRNLCGINKIVLEKSKVCTLIISIFLMHIYFIISIFIILHIHTGYFLVIDICYTVFSLLLCALYVGEIYNFVK